jgi:hypothetical protein
MSIVLQSSGGGQITVQEPTTASNFTQNLPAADGTVMVSGNQPAFSASMSGQQSISAATTTKIAFNVEDFDTNNNFDTANNRFTPTVAGYYQFNLNIYAANGTMSNTNLNFYKNGAAYTQPVYVASGFIMQSCSALIFLNGSTDYVEVYFNNQFACFVNSGQTAPTFCRFSGSLVRGA